MDFKIIRKIIRDLIRIDKVAVPRCDLLTFACDNDRHFNYQGKAYSPLMSTIEDDLAVLGVTSVSVSRIASDLKGDKAHGNVISPEGDFARALIGKRLKHMMNRRRYPYSFAEEKIWDRLLERSGARAVVGILPSRELCQVCKRRGIWVADLQHGVITPSHPWYDPRKRLPEPSDWVPNAFLVWDEGTAKALSTWVPQKAGEIHIIGNPWTARFQRDDSGDDLVVGVTTCYPKVAKEKPQILVSLSWGTANIPNGFIHPALEKVMLDTSSRYSWQIRLHPNQMRGFAANEGTSFISYFDKTFGGTDIEWKLASELPLPLLLTRTDLHITWSSSICIEAAGFGIRSLLLDPAIYPGAEKQDYFEYLVEGGYAHKDRPESDSISFWIEQNIGINFPSAESYHANYMNVCEKIAAIALEKHRP